MGDSNCWDRSLPSHPHHSCSVSSWKLLSKSFRVWRHLSQRRQAVAKATATKHRQLIRKRLRELRWVLWLQEARLEAAWGQATSKGPGSPELPRGPGSPACGLWVVCLRGDHFTERGRLLQVAAHNHLLGLLLWLLLFASLG